MPIRPIRLPLLSLSLGALGIATSLASAGATSFVNWESPHVSPIALTPSGSTLLAVNTADNRLEIFALSGGTPVHVKSVPVGLDPVSVRVRSESEAWVVNHISDSISIVDLPSGRVTRTITVGDEPADVVFAGNPTRAFVTLSQLNRVLVLDPANPAAPGTNVAIQGEDPRSLAVSPDGTRVYAAIFESGNHSTLLSRNQVSGPGGPYGGQNPPPNNGNVFDPPIAIGLAQPPVVTHIVRKQTDGTWRDGNNRNWTSFVTWDLHDHDVAIIDANSLGVTYSNGLMTTVAAVTVAPDGTVTAVGTEAKNEIRFEENLNGIFIRSHVASFAAATPNAPSIDDLNPHLDYSTPSVSMVDRDQSIGDPRGIIWHPNGSAAYITGMGSNNVVVMNAAGNRVGVIDVGEGPTGVAITTDGARLYVLDRFEGAISVIDTAASAEIDRVAFFDPTPQPIKIGRPFLFDSHITSGLGQASCASCHVDGRTDHLAWDLGSPQGTMLPFDQECNGPPPGNCTPWHPMKGPMVTQTLQGIIGNEPLHWRGEKPGIEDFNVAYTHLQGADSELTSVEMQRLKDYVATIAFPPNPNRNIDNTLKNTLPVFNGNGNPINGRNIYLNVPTLGGAACVVCHSLPTGSNLEVAGPVGPEPQNRKVSPLRNMHEKAGANRNSQQANRGFGFNHDGEHFTITELLNVGFQFQPGPPGQQQRRDVEAFMLSFATDTHAGVGAQTTAANGGGVGDNVALIDQMTALATSNQVSLIVKGRIGALDRGFAFVNGVFQGDRAADIRTPAQLLAASAPGNELTYTLVPFGLQIRLGIDRDEDSYYDRDEIDAGSDPADPKSIPTADCIGDVAPLGGDGFVNGADLSVLLGLWGGPGPADLDGSGTIDASDLAIMLGHWGACP
jgi:YVTN family beta-propeller protein